MNAPALAPEVQAQLAKLATDLAHNPKTRKQFTKLVKEIDPTKRFPDIEAEELEEKMQREFEKRDHEAEAKRTQDRLEKQKESLKSRFKDEDISEIEKLMEKHGISDYDVGAKLYAAETKPAEPTYEMQDRAWSLPKIDIKDFGNLKAQARKNAYQAIDDIKRKRAS
jgi:hypothetical protein